MGYAPRRLVRFAPGSGVKPLAGSTGELLVRLRLILPLVAMVVLILYGCGTTPEDCSSMLFCMEPEPCSAGGCTDASTGAGGGGGGGGSGGTDGGTNDGG